MRVLKRIGTYEDVSFDKVLRRIKHFSYNLDHVDASEIAQKVCSRIYDGVKTSELDELAAQMCFSMSTEHPDFGTLAARIIISNIHKNTAASFDETVEILYSNKDIHGNPAPLVSDELYQSVKEHKHAIDAAIDYERDYLFDYFGYKTLERSYLQKVGGRTIERPQHMWMRVALGIWGQDIKGALECYKYMSMRYYTHATPTLFNAGTRMPAMSSCFLLGMEDSLCGIYKTIGDSAMISKGAGGIGTHIHDIRARGSYIRGTNGQSSGLVPMLRVYNATMRHANQAGRRLGSAAIYVEPWHADIFDFVALRRNTGAEEERCRDLFLALWVPDLFMERVKANGTWSLMCPDECPGLSKVYGTDFKDLYERYEREGRMRKTVKAQDLWTEVLKSQIETGTPYILYKDACQKSNQKNLGVIRSSNLCVAPETQILTDKGYVVIKDVVNQEVNVWNGQQFSKTTVIKTGSNMNLIKIKFSNGESLECTSYHKFYIKPEYNKKEIIVPARELKLGMKIAKSEFPIMYMDGCDFKYPYTHGLFCAEGTYCQRAGNRRQCSYQFREGQNFCKKHAVQAKYDIATDDIELDYSKCHGICDKVPRITLYGKKMELLPYVDIRDDVSIGVSKNECIHVFPHLDMAPKFVVPTYENMNIKLRWFEGLCDGDGTLTKSESAYQLQVSNIHHDFLIKVKRMLNTMGIDAKITVVHEKALRSLPDGKGGHADYYCDTCYRLLVTCTHLHKLIALGFQPKRLDFTGMSVPNRNCQGYTRVVAIEDVNRVDDTYCFNEPLEHKGIFNGILTGNCSEILIYSDENEYGVCNLASIVLPSFVSRANTAQPSFDYDKLHEVVKFVTRSMDHVIDRNHYPVPETRRSNMRHRPIGIGIQGLADVFIQMRLPYDSPEALEVNRLIAETMYHASLESSNDIARERCEAIKLTDEEQAQAVAHPKWRGAYGTFSTSPAARGILQFDMHSKQPTPGRYDWAALKEAIQHHGLRHSLLIALMPTASTSQVMGSTESFEAITSNIFQRRTLAGEFVVLNKYLVSDLVKLGLWNRTLKDRIIASEGSVQHIPDVPDDIKALYKTVWEIKQRVIIDHAAARQPFVCQTQSMNLYVEDPDISKMTNMHFYGWRNGLKTGCYYLRSKAKAKTMSFSLDPSVSSGNMKKEKTNDIESCRLDNPEGCVMCSA